MYQRANDEGTAGPGPPGLARSATLQRIQAQASIHVRSTARTKLSKSEKDKAMNILGRSYLKNWLSSHGQHLRPPKLHTSVRRVIEAWFDLVDEDGSGGLDSSELATALKTAGLPCDEQSILEMLKLMDMNGDGEISWAEFEAFLTSEFAAGKALLSGEYVLPSGTALPFGAMVSKLKRNRIIADVLEGGQRRERWSTIAKDEHKLSAELSLLHRAEEEQAAFRRHAMLNRSHDNKSRSGTVSSDVDEPIEPVNVLEQSAPPTLSTVTPTTTAPGLANPTTATANEVTDVSHLDSHTLGRDPEPQTDSSSQACFLTGGVLGSENSQLLPLPGLSSRTSQSGTPDVRGYRALLGAATTSAVKLLNTLTASSSGRLSVGLISPGRRDGLENNSIPPPPPPATDKETDKRKGLTASILQHTLTRRLNLQPSSCSSSMSRTSQLKLPQPVAYISPYTKIAVQHDSPTQSSSGSISHHVPVRQESCKEARAMVATAVIQQHNLVDLFAQAVDDDEQLADREVGEALPSLDLHVLRKSLSEQDFDVSPPQGHKQCRADEGRSVSVCGLQEFKAMHHDDGVGVGQGVGGVGVGYMGFARDRGSLSNPILTRHGLSIEQVIQSRTPHASAVATGAVRASYLKDALMSASHKGSLNTPSKLQSSNTQQAPQAQGVVVLPLLMQKTNEGVVVDMRRSTSCATLPALNIQMALHHNSGSVDQQVSPTSDTRGSLVRGSMWKHNQKASDQGVGLIVGVARG